MSEVIQGFRSKFWQKGEAHEVIERFVSVISRHRKTKRMDDIATHDSNKHDMKVSNE